MNDLISRQLVMKTLCERRCGDKPKGCPSGFCTESLALDCIPSAKPAQQWIPCSERLPEDVLCVTLVTDGMDVWAETWVGIVGKWKYNHSTITAWMPLPEPYKAERSEECLKQENTNQ